MKRLISFLLLALLVLQPLTALAGAETPRVTAGMLNPLYADEIDEAALSKLTEQPAQNTPPKQYSSVSDAAKELRAQMKNRNTTISFMLTGYQFTEALLKQIMAEALSHTGNPTEGDYLLYQMGGWSAETYGYQVTFYIAWHDTAAQEQQVTTAVNSLLSTLNLNGKTREQKLRAIYDYMTMNITYDYDHLNQSDYTLKYTAYGALVNRTAVCQGYAVLLYRLLLECGIDCRIIDGTGYGGNTSGPHAWNIVRVGNKNLYYNVDVTWDAAYYGKPQTYNWYLRGSANFTDHARSADYTTNQFNTSYPTSTADYNAQTDAETPTPANPTQFTDVPAGKFYTDAVLWAVAKGITNGMTPTEFWPESTCTRGQIVTFLWRAKGSPSPKTSYMPFTDVETGRYYTKAVLWAVENSITSGMTKTTFEPERGCTRGQVVTFLWRAEGKPTTGENELPIIPIRATSFTDVQQGAYYYDAVLWAVSQGITNGMTATEFWPDYTCTRAQIVTFLYRTYK